MLTMAIFSALIMLKMDSTYLVIYCLHLNIQEGLQSVCIQNQQIAFWSAISLYNARDHQMNTDAVSMML